MMVDGDFKKLKIEKVAAAAVFSILCCLLLIRPIIGVADNGDFARIMNSTGLYALTNEPAERYFGFVNRQYGTGYVIPLGGGYLSTQIPLVLLAVYLSKSALGKSLFDIRFLAIIYILVLSTAVFFTVGSIRKKSSFLAFVAAFLMIFIFCDIGYSSYFNSLYGEPVTLVFLLLMAAMAVTITFEEKPAVWMLVLFCIGAFFFAGGKIQNSPAGLLAALVCARLTGIYSEENKGKRRLMTKTPGRTTPPETNRGETFKMDETVSVAEQDETSAVASAAEKNETSANGGTVPTYGIAEKDKTSGNGGTASMYEIPAAEPPVAKASLAEAALGEVSVGEAPVAEASMTEAFMTEALVTGSPISKAPISVTPVTETSVGGLKGKVWKRISVGSALLVVLISLGCYFSVSREIKVCNKYQTVFYGILKGSPDPTGDLEKLGLDPSLAVLAGTNYFMEQYPIDIRDPAFKEMIYEKVSHFKVAGFYLKHPLRLLQKLENVAEHGFQLKQGFGNYEKYDGIQYKQTSNVFGFWSDFKMVVLPHTLPFVIIFFTIGMLVLLYEYKRASSPRMRFLIEFFGFIMLTGIMQFVLPVIGDGDADLSKHLYLFNVCFDLLFAAGTIYTAQKAAAAVRSLRSRRLAARLQTD